MPENDSVDILTAFAIGAMIGVGATLLLRSDPETTTDRIVKGFKPIARRVRKAAGQAGKEYGKSLRLTGRATSRLGGAGKDAMEDLQSQIEDILSSAREELTDTARKQMKAARRSLRQFRS